MRRQLVVIALLIACPAIWSTLRPAAAHPKLDCRSCHTPQDQTIDPAQVWSTWSTRVSDDSFSAPLPRALQSKTLDARVGIPDGASRMCLSCHDGSNAQVSPAHTFGSSASDGMGPLAASHPVSFVYDQVLVAQDRHLVNPSSLPHGVLDSDGKMQCTSCHDVHADTPKDLRWPYDNRRPQTTAAFCRNCHMK